jgi:hypothetical protein
MMMHSPRLNTRSAENCIDHRLMLRSLTSSHKCNSSDGDGASLRKLSVPKSKLVTATSSSSSFQRVGVRIEQVESDVQAMPVASCIIRWNWMVSPISHSRCGMLGSPGGDAVYLFRIGVYKSWRKCQGQETLSTLVVWRNV